MCSNVIALLFELFCNVEGVTRFPLPVGEPQPTETPPAPTDTDVTNEFPPHDPEPDTDAPGGPAGPCGPAGPAEPVAPAGPAGP